MTLSRLQLAAFALGFFMLGWAAHGIVFLARHRVPQTVKGEMKMRLDPSLFEARNRAILDIEQRLKRLESQRGLPAVRGVKTLP